MPLSAAHESALSSALLSLKPYAIGIGLGVLTLALGEGAQDNAGFVGALHDHWIVWGASSLMTLVGGGTGRFVQKTMAINSGTVDQAIQTKAANPIVTPTPGGNP